MTLSKSQKLIWRKIWVAVNCKIPTPCSLNFTFRKFLEHSVMPSKCGFSLLRTGPRLTSELDWRPATLTLSKSLSSFQIWYHPITKYKGCSDARTFRYILYFTKDTHGLRKPWIMVTQVKLYDVAFVLTCGWLVVYCSVELN